jgi:hypothetical protein
MKVEARDLAFGVVAIAVVDKGVEGVRNAVDRDCGSGEIVAGKL